MAGPPVLSVAVTFHDWIGKLVSERFGTQTALANAIGLQLTSFSRGAEDGTFSVVNLLKLARATDTPASEVLRLAGKGEVAELIESLYGDGVSALTSSEQQLVARWRNISPSARKALDHILEDLQLTPAATVASEPVRKKKSA